MSGSLSIEKQDGCIIAKDINLAIAKESLLYHGRDLQLVGDVCTDKACLSPGFANSICHALRTINVNLGYNHSCAF